jgi:molybdopterin-guanine dinucleotide biosynthesis protein A
MSTLGAVLAGGSSTRMGADKASVVVDGLTMLERVSAALSEAFPHVVVRIESWPDEMPGGGPLAGIASALSRMEEDRVLVVAVDQPFVRTETLAALASM